MKSKINKIAAIVAISCIFTFFTSTILVELFGTREWIVILKNLIVFPGLFILVPAIAMTGGTGFFFSKKQKGPSG